MGLGGGSGGLGGMERDGQPAPGPLTHSSSDKGPYHPGPGGVDVGGLHADLGGGGSGVGGRSVTSRHPPLYPHAGHY